MNALVYNLHSEVKEDSLSPKLPQIVFSSLYENDLYLFPITGFKPVNLKLKLVEGNQFPTSLVLENATPPFDYIYENMNISMRNFDRGGGTLISVHATSQVAHGNSVCEWKNSGLILGGNTNIISGNKITLNTIGANTEIFISASASKVKNPVLRLRRTYDTLVAAEVVASGNGTKVSYAFTLANTTICPSSVKVSFTDSTGLKTGKIRDNGYGLFGSVPQTFYLLGMADSKIDYATGKCSLNFSVAHVPANTTNITVSYEYNSTGIVDSSNYKAEWSYEY